MASEPITNRACDRAERRDEVLYRTRATLADRRQFPATIVNLSPHGMMLRSDAPVTAGERLRVRLLIAGEVDAAVRWALGGRIGCAIDGDAAAANYPAVLAAMRG